MDRHRLAYFLEDFVAPIVAIDGQLFVDREGEGEAALRERIASHRSLREAQRWINTVLIEQFIDAVVGDTWSMTDPEAQRILSIYEKAWTHQIAAAHPAVSFAIERIVDEDGGDFGLRLIQDR